MLQFFLLSLMLGNIKVLLSSSTRSNKELDRFSGSLVQISEQEPEGELVMGSCHEQINICIDINYSWSALKQQIQR